MSLCLLCRRRLLVPAETQQGSSYAVGRNGTCEALGLALKEGGHVGTGQEGAPGGPWAGLVAVGNSRPVYSC